MVRKRTKTRRPGVPCPHCGAALSSVTRTTQRGDGLQRIRRCNGCRKLFITTEAARKSDTDVTAIATGVISLARALNLNPKSFLSNDPAR